MNTIAELSIFPIGQGESVSPFVAEAVKFISKSGLKYETNPMGTCIEGELNEVMNVVTGCFESMKKHSKRIYMLLKIDYRADRTLPMSSKVQSVSEMIA